MRNKLEKIHLEMLIFFFNQTNNLSWNLIVKSMTARDQVNQREIKSIDQLHKGCCCSSTRRWEAPPTSSLLPLWLCSSSSHLVSEVVCVQPACRCVQTFTNYFLRFSCSFWRSRSPLAVRSGVKGHRWRQVLGTIFDLLLLYNTKYELLCFYRCLYVLLRTPATQ